MIAEVFENLFKPASEEEIENRKPDQIAKKGERVRVVSKDGVLLSGVKRVNLTYGEEGTLVGDPEWINNLGVYYYSVLFDSKPELTITVLDYEIEKIG